MNWMIAQGDLVFYAPKTGPIMKFYTSVHEDWLSISSTNFVSFDALFE